VNEALRQRLAGRLRSVEGVVESPSVFGPGNAVWCNGREIAHFDADGSLDLRLTKSVIRELRPLLRNDPRVELRRGRSDWIELHVSSSDDIAFALELAERAAAAHRAPAGQDAKQPPVGSELDRRRPFH
jgi:hypothetical protein